MSIICKNCGNVFEGNYCNICGQKAETHPIDVHFIAHDLQHGLLHYEGGIVYSAKELFTRPGHAIRDYIEGKRVKHYKPISMLIVLATFYGLFYHVLNIDIFSNKENTLLNYEKLNEWIAHHFSIITLLLLPILSLSSYLLFKKQGYNYTEHLILNSFYSSQKLFLRILTLPLFIFVKNPETVLLIIRGMMILDILLMFWSYGQFFNKLPKSKVFMLSIIATLINIFIMFLITTLVLTIIISM